MDKKVPGKAIEQSRAHLLEKTAQALQDLQAGKPGPRILNFWGSKGMGKTTLLNHIVRDLQQRSPQSLITLIDLEGLPPAELEKITPAGFHDIPQQDGAVLLLDNLDVLLRATRDGQVFFDFEEGVILPLVERGRTLLVTSSLYEINQWREDDVSVKQVNIQIPALEESEVRAMAEKVEVGAEKVFELTFGQPKVVSWMLKEPRLDEREIARRATDFFLEGIPQPARAIADMICLLPVFNAYLLRLVINHDPAKPEAQYLECLDWLKEYIRRGLVYWDAAPGSYRFTDSAVRRLLARQVLFSNPGLFDQIQSITAGYYTGEAKSPGYLHHHLVNALYHLAQSNHARPAAQIGEICLDWFREHVRYWSGAPWREVAAAWQNGDGEPAIRSELVGLMGLAAFEQIAGEIEQIRKNLEANHDNKQ